MLNSRFQFIDRICYALTRSGRLLSFTISLFWFNFTILLRNNNITWIVCSHALAAFEGLAARDELSDRIGRNYLLGLVLNQLFQMLQLRCFTPHLRQLSQLSEYLIAP